MKKFAITLCVVIAFLGFQQINPPTTYGADNFTIKKVSEGIFAAIAKPGGKAASNALIIIGKTQVTIAGAHFVADVISDLSREASKFTPLPIRAVILTHHHKGFAFVDFDFPKSYDIYMSWQTWQNIKSERRSLKNGVIFFETGLTINRDNMIISLTNTGRGHTSGDILVYFPDSGVLFTSDLLFNDTVGYMGDGTMRDWLLTLDAVEEIGATTIIPGLGEPSNSTAISRFRDFFREFVTEVLRLKAAGKTFPVAVKEFTLPEKYMNLPGYNTYIKANIERAYNDASLP